MRETKTIHWSYPDHYYVRLCCDEKESNQTPKKCVPCFDMPRNRVLEETNAPRHYFNTTITQCHNSMTSMLLEVSKTQQCPTRAFYYSYLFVQ